MKNTGNPKVWVITEGMVGTENQCLGVTEALGIIPVVKKINLNFPWKLLSPWLGFECPATFAEKLEGPWPDILITSGRKSIATSRYIKKQSNGKTFTVHIQDPRFAARQFNLIAIPQHDPTRGSNVFLTTATPNRITEDKLALAKSDWAHIFEKMNGPRVAVLIGGTTSRHVFTADEAMELVQKIAPIPNLMITTSRRTGPEKDVLFRRNLAFNGNYLWDGTGANPYMGMLAWADYILVTADSTSMISDAASTGKPVYVLPMEGITRRQQLLVTNLTTYGAVRPYTGPHLEHWNYNRLRDSELIAAEIRRKSGLSFNLDFT